MHIKIFILLSFLFLSRCQIREIKVIPDKTIIYLNNKKVNSKDIKNRLKTGDTLLFSKSGYYPIQYTIPKQKPNKLHIFLKSEKFPLLIKTHPVKCNVFIDDNFIGQTPVHNVKIKYGIHLLRFEKTGYKSLSHTLNIQQNTNIYKKLVKETSRHNFKNLLNCGPEPKQIIFTPDEKYILTALLDDRGFELIDYKMNKIIKKVNISKKEGKKGFVEIIFNKNGDRFFISQMLTNKVFIFAYPGLNLINTIETKGSWPKIMALNRTENRIAVSHWTSHNITVFELNDQDEFKLLANLKNQGKSPRGLAFDKHDKYLYAAYFNSGHIIKFNCTTWKPVKTWFTGGCNRHIIIDKNNQYAYISNMYYNCVYKLNLENNKITSKIMVGRNPNTIAMNQDGKYLYVSCRGENNKQGYLVRSPKNGSIHIIDTDKNKVTEIIEGGNQPTGLDISSSGRYFAFSNFKDNTIEVYTINEEGWQ